MAITAVAPRTLTDEEAKERDELQWRICGALIGSLDLVSVYLGDALGLYGALAEGGPATSLELARRAGIAERYAREWLEHQAVTGILTVDDASKDADKRAYALPRGHAVALLDFDHSWSATPLARCLPAIGGMLPRLVETFRTGGGIAWADYGDGLWQVQSDFARSTYRHQLTEETLPKIEDVHAKLGAGARVADIACGAGWSSIAIAKAYPRTTVHGFDLDARAIAAARRQAEADGLADRVTFEVRDAADPKLAGGYDIAFVFEAVHDLSRPVEVLRAARALVGEGGTVLVADENAGETFTAPGGDVDRLLYGFSLTVCLPNGLAEQPSAATGAVMRPATLRRYAMAAGFNDVEVLPVEIGLLRFYRLT